MRVGTAARRRALAGWGAVILVTLAGVAGSAAGSAGAQPPQPTSSSYQRGGLLYAQNCAQCHGAGGAGGPVAGGGRAPSLLAEENPEVTVAYVDLVLSTGRMPPAGSPFDNRDRRVVFGDPADRADLITWMSQEFGTDGDIPEVGPGDAAQGLEIWTANCSHCHGATGAGGVAGAGTWTPQVNTRTPVEIAEAIRVGPFQMPGFEPEQISDQEVADVTAFLTTIEGEERTPLFGLLELNPVYASGFVAGVAALMLLSLVWIAGRPRGLPRSPAGSGTGRGKAVSPAQGVGPGASQVGPDAARTVLSSEAPPPSQVNDALVVGLSIAAAACALVFALALTFGGPMGLYGGALALGLFCLAAAVRRYFADRFPDVEALEPRHADAGQEAEGGTLADLADVKPVGRRPFLRRILMAAAGVFGLSLAAPVASLGPSPGDRLRTTAWRAGARLVTTDGERLRPDDVAEGGISSVWPEGAVGDERSAVILLRLTGEPEPPTNPDWVVGDHLLAYSKVCTHAGCPVALYRQRDEALFCPCHQSTFDVTRGAVPTFGPAARALPQLPLGVDDAGFLIALGDFAEPVGPAYG